MLKMLRLVLLPAAVLLIGCERTPQPAKATATPQAGIVNGLPPGVASVAGSCSGVIALTPSRSSAQGFDISYPLVYRCATGTFEVPGTDGALPGGSRVGDLTIRPNGYYMHSFRTVDLVRHGAYMFFDKQGKLLKRVAPPDMDAHDVIPSTDSLLYMRYVPDRAAASCRSRAVVELELIEEDNSGKQRWAWQSRGKIQPGWKVSTEENVLLAAEPGWQKIVRPVRHCYSYLLNRFFGVQTPAAFLLPGKWALVQLNLNDYIHGNSLDLVGPNRDVLVSARHLDTIFLINRASGAIQWSLGGPFSRMTNRRPVGDPQGGFSHQHSAVIRGDKLYVFDNANRFEGKPSRLVVYSVTPDNLADAKFVFAFPEPRGVQRRAFGSVQPVDDSQVLIGWGAIKPEDRKTVQRAASLVDTASGKEMFSIDLQPGWASYRAKWSTEP
jgi:hypothetical protein